MAIQQVSFTSNNEKNHSAFRDVLSVGVKGGTAAVVGYALGKYVIPVSDNFAEGVLRYSLADSFLKEKSEKASTRKAKKTSGDEALHQGKAANPKAKTNFYYEFKKMSQKQWANFIKQFNKYEEKLFTKNGGKEVYIKEIKPILKSGIGKVLGALLGGIFTIAAIVDVSSKARRRSDK